MKVLGDTKISKLRYNGEGFFTRYLIGGASGLYLYIYPNGKRKYKLNIKGTIKSLYDDEGHELFYPQTAPDVARLYALKAIQSGAVVVPKKKEFGAIADEYFNTKKSKVTQKTIEKDLYRYNRYIAPMLKNEPISKITAADIADVIKTAEKRAKSRGAGAETPQRVKNIISQIFDYAVICGRADYNPTPRKIDTILTQKPVKRHFATITEPKEIGELLRAIDNSKRDLNTKNALLFSILTAQRSQNIRFLKWSDISVSGGLTIVSYSSEVMKMRREHKIALSNEAKNILEMQKKMRVNEYVFFGLTKKGCLSEATLNKYLKALGYKDRFTTHSVRSMFKTICAQNRDKHLQNAEVEEMCLAHAQKDAIISAYQRGFLLESQFKLFEWYSNYLKECKGVGLDS